ncbi:hypothetical protein [Metabacillus fastidiosus]|uniref:hypothetical protein n=1 Tax=Metabacillus fastidiosus TaxID=1458 RepID=UPI003D294246
MSLFASISSSEDIVKRDSPPSSRNVIWFDTSHKIPQIKIFDNLKNDWVVLNTDDEIEVSLIPPSSTSKIWLDLSTFTFKVYVDEIWKTVGGNSSSGGTGETSLKVGTTTISANPIELEAGSGVTLQADSTSNKLTISSTGSGSVGLPISANDVTETSEKQFLSASKKAQIDGNIAELASHSQRLSNLENGQVTSSDEKVKLNALDATSGYLEDKLDNMTIQSSGGKLTAKTLDGLQSSITELNFLQGVNSNIQQQINNVSGVSNFRGVFTTLTDLQATLNPMAGEYAIVSNGSSSAYYFYYDSIWNYSHETTGASSINIDSGTIGILPKSRYEKQDASETPFTDISGKITSTNMKDALIEVFLKSENIKSSVAGILGSPLLSSDTLDQLKTKLSTLKINLAQAITDKGVVSYPYNTLEEMTNKVKAIPNVSIQGKLKSTSKLNITAPRSISIQLSEPLKVEDIATTVLQYVGNDTGVVHYSAEYNNGEASSFTYDPNGIIFDGFMNIKDKWNYTLTEVELDSLYETEEIDFSQFVDFSGDLTVDTVGKLASFNGLKSTSEVIKASGDISLVGVESLDKINLITSTLGNGISKLAISFDSGLTWIAYDGLNWINLNVDDKTDFKLKGMNKSVVDTLTDMQLSIARNESNTIRFAYYLERPLYSDVAKNDKIELVVSMRGRNELTSTSFYNYSYDNSTKILSFNFKLNGTYTINYLDGV